MTHTITLMLNFFVKAKLKHAKQNLLGLVSQWKNKLSLVTC